MAGDSRYTPLVGAIGMGEEARPPHAQAAPLARLLLEHGADPYDLQVIYNIAMSRTDVRWVLELLHTHCIRTGREADWNDPEWRMFDMGDYGSGARWLLGHAVAEDDLALAEWLLVHGASPNAAPPADPRWRNRSLHEEALCGNSTEMAELLARFGATVSHLERTGIDAFASACLRMDVALVQTLAAAHPEYLRSPMALFAAAKHDRADVLALLQELGASSEVEDAQHQRALHVAAYAGALRAAGLLIEHGAEPDPRESRWGATPLGFAAHAMIQPMIDLLSTVSRDVFELTFAGKVERVREVLAAEPALARTIHPDGETPLMRLPNDEVAALALARLLLAHGADPAQRDSRGPTAADMAARRGLEAVAALLRERSAERDEQARRAIGQARAPSESRQQAAFRRQHPVHLARGPHPQRRTGHHVAGPVLVVADA